MAPATLTMPGDPNAEDFEGLFGNAFRDRRVVVTGHTGFKGAWLCEWLIALGARVSGFSLPPDTNPSLFTQLRLAERMEGVFGDVQDGDALKRLVVESQPDFVFHLAAQSLVRRSYRLPLLTWQSNVIGTIHLLEALRGLEKTVAAILVTTDKCYDNREWIYGYREDDPLGGQDPYSASKAATELAIHAWRQSYFRSHPVRIASARAGNVIGGGDWAEDRILPDCARAWLADRAVRVRNPHATRPWQHVLEPLSGYLWLAARLASPDPDARLSGPFNFGPGHDGNRSVRELVEEARRYIGCAWEDVSDPTAPHEARLLQLSTDKAAAVLGWNPVWSFSVSVQETVKWYFDVGLSPEPGAAAGRTRDQILTYVATAAAKGLPWAVRPPASDPAEPPTESQKLA